MPYSSAWVSPEVYLTRGDVTVYHVYKDDDVEQSRLWCYYTTDELASMSLYSEEDGGQGVFDVRDLAGWTPECDHAAIIIAAIDRGDLPIAED